MDISHEIGLKIRYYRKNRQMTVDQLAEAICKSKSCVSKYENGQIAVDLPTLYDIAAALDVGVTQLLYLPPSQRNGTTAGEVPAFFAGLHKQPGKMQGGRGIASNCTKHSQHLPGLEKILCNNI